MTWEGKEEEVLNARERPANREPKETTMLARSDWPRDAGEQFWEAYPRRVAKKAAMVALERVRKSGEVPFEVLLSAVKMYARSVVGKEMRFIAHPTTWLNQGRWDDDPAALINRPVKAAAAENREGVIIKRFSLQARAWEQCRGKPFPWGPSGTWMVPTEWPPQPGTHDDA